MLPFVPRKVAKALNARSNASQLPAPKVTKLEETGPQAGQAGPSKPSGGIAQTRAPITLDATSRDTKGKGKQTGIGGGLSDEDCAILLRLSVTEHALWSDPDLRRTLEFSDDGFIPLLYVTSRSSYFFGGKNEPSERDLIRAIRAHASDTFEIRLLMSSPSKEAWSGRDTSSREKLGAYEVRIKAWTLLLDTARNGGKNEWESKTVYVENVSSSYRSVAGIHRFVSALSDPSDTDSSIQNITLPRHHADRPEDPPKCKGFALITFKTLEAANYLLRCWPWKRSDSFADIQDSPEAQDAAKFGFRAISKSSWDKLNAEYLEHRQRLLDGITHRQGVPPPNAHEAPVSAPTTNPLEVLPAERSQQPPTLDISAPYPLGCLVHVRHIYPETNKTTLRKLFSVAFREADAQSSNEGIDYIDFTKNMDTCYLRLSSPDYTQRLVAHFVTNTTVHSKGLDDAGCPAADNLKAISIEIVDGTREELYWSKVPEKVRRQAVEKAVLGIQAGNGSANEHNKRKGGKGGEENSGGRKRKRKR